MRAYLDDSPGLNQGALAERVGVSQSMISDWANDRRHPSLRNAYELERATGGAVPVSSWVSRDLVDRPGRKATAS